MLFFDDHHPNHAAHGLVGGQKGLVSLGDRFSVHRTRDRLPALPMSGAFGQTDPVLPVRGRTPPSTSLAGPQWAQAGRESGILAESANDGRARGDGRLQERRLGVSPIDDHPQRLSRLFYQRCDPLDQAGRQFELGPESPAGASWGWWESSSGGRTTWPAAAGPAGPTTDAAAPATA